ncbi:MAG: Calx-beta domain-containing protein, partial [Bacteroidota bacterium]
MKYRILIYLSTLFLIISCNEQVTDAPKVLPKLSINNSSLPEGDEENPVVELTVQLTGDYEGGVSVNYKTLTESAFRGLDFEYQQGTLEFVAPETEKIISIEIIADQIKEASEEFIVALSNAEGAEIERARSTILIKDDDDQLDL